MKEFHQAPGRPGLGRIVWEGQKMLPGEEFHMTQTQHCLIYIFQIQDVNILIYKGNHTIN